MPERILHKAKQASLTDEEKLKMRTSLEAFMAINPVSAASSVSVASPYSKFYAFMLHQKKLVPAFLALALVLTGGTAFAANGSLPGDKLYAVKVNVNENVETFLAFGAEANAKIKASQASRRLEEAEKLAVQGKLDASAKVSIEANFKANAEEASRSIKALKANGNANVAVAISSDFENSLAAHQEVLNSLSVGADQNNGSQVALNSIVTAVNQRLASVTETRARAEVLAGTSSQEGTVRTSAEGTLAAAKQKAEDVRKFASRQASRGRISEETRAALDARVSEADKLIAEGEAKIHAGAYGEAFVTLKTAQRAAQGVQALVSSIAKAGIKANAKFGAASSSAAATASAALATSPATSSAGAAATVAATAKVGTTTGTGTPVTAASVASVSATTSAATATGVMFAAPASASATVNAVINAVIPVIHSGSHQPAANVITEVKAGINSAVSGLKK